MHLGCDCILGCLMHVWALTLARWRTAVWKGGGVRRVAMERYYSCAHGGGSPMDVSILQQLQSALKLVCISSMSCRVHVGYGR